MTSRSIRGGNGHAEDLVGLADRRMNRLALQRYSSPKLTRMLILSLSDIALCLCRNAGGSPMKTSPFRQRRASAPRAANASPKLAYTIASEALDKCFS